jgi:hypothetical protein
MASYQRARIDLTEAQAKKLMQGHAVQIAYSQLGRGEGGISLHPENAAKVARAYSSKKGFKLKMSMGELADTIQNAAGGSFWKKLWGGLKDVWKVLKDSGAASQLADMAVGPLAAFTGQPAIVGAVRKGVKDLTGVGMQRPARVSKSDKYGQLKAAGLYLS